MPTTNAQGYTAGPWYVTASSPDGYVYGADHSCIVPFGPESAGRMDARRWTDARLISAAPELLQALERQTQYLAALDGLLRTLPVPSEHAFPGARQFGEVLCGAKGGIAESCAIARQIIAKARGE